MLSASGYLKTACSRCLPCVPDGGGLETVVSRRLLHLVILTLILLFCPSEFTTTGPGVCHVLSDSNSPRLEEQAMHSSLMGAYRGGPA